jgi:hypothetical protein
MAFLSIIHGLTILLCCLMIAQAIVTNISIPVESCLVENCLVVWENDRVSDEMVGLLILLRAWFNIAGYNRHIGDRLE